jgi:hypothetical protein
VISRSPIPDVDFLIIDLSGDDIARQGQYRKYVSVYLKELRNHRAVREQRWASDDGISYLRMWLQRRQREENVFVERDRIAAVGKRCSLCSRKSECGRTNVSLVLSPLRHLKEADQLTWLH